MRLLNFQCYRDSGEIPINHMTIFIGENDSGKSCILKSIDIFLNNKLPDLNMFHSLNGNRENLISMSLKFKIDGDEEIPKEFVVGGMLSLKKEFSLNEAGEIKLDIFINKHVLKKSELNNIKDLKSPQLKELCSELNLEYNGVDEAKTTLINYVNKNFKSLDKEIGFSSIKWSEIFHLLPAFEYYNSSDYGNPQRHVETTLRDIYKSFFYDYDKSGNESLKKEYISKKNEIEQVLDEQIKEILKEKVAAKNGKIKNIYGEYSIDFSGGFSLSDILVDYGQGPHSINIIGEGSKKRLFLAIIEWDKEIKFKENHKMVIRGYDEPDASLHYSAQREMYYTLRDLSSNQSSQVQVIICTHSVSMIDRAPARIINHIVQDNGISHVDYLKDYDEEDIKEFLDSISEISGIKNSSLFFERCFVIFEGDTEENALPIFYKKLVSRSISEDGVVLINLQGNASWESFLKLLNKNKKSATILFIDRDTQSDQSRKITLDKLRQINFDEDFLENNVILIGKDEFEDIFSDELICRCLNTYWPKKDNDIWTEYEISALRKNRKFSESIIKCVRNYMHDHYGREARIPGKPELGKRIAETASNQDINGIRELTSLIQKINEIIG